MNENDFGAKISRALNTGLTRIEDDKLTRLQAARAKALAAYREPVRLLGLRLGSRYAPIRMSVSFQRCGRATKTTGRGSGTLWKLCKI